MRLVNWELPNQVQSLDSQKEKNQQLNTKESIWRPLRSHDYHLMVGVENPNSSYTSLYDQPISRSASSYSFNHPLMFVMMVPRTWGTLVFWALMMIDLLLSCVWMFCQGWYVEVLDVPNRKNGRSARPILSPGIRRMGFSLPPDP